MMAKAIKESQIVPKMKPNCLFFLANITILEKNKPAKTEIAITSE